jgi:hypothetical protein
MKRNFCKFENISLIFLLSLALFCLQISAQQEVSDSIVRKRIQCIQKTLNKDKINTQRWWYGWLGGYSAATLVQATIGFSSNSKSTRQDMGLGAITTSLGVLGQFFTPIIPGCGADSLANFSENNQENQLVKLIQAEEMLKKVALAEKEARSWKVHAVTGAVNLGGALITWLGFKRSVWDGATFFALNTIVTEVQIWSMPGRAMKDYRIYCDKFYSNEKQSAFEPKWFVGIYPGTIQITLLF